MVSFLFQGLCLHNKRVCSFQVYYETSMYISDEEDFVVKEITTLV